MTANVARLRQLAACVVSDHCVCVNKCEASRACSVGALCDQNGQSVPASLQPRGLAKESSYEDLYGLKAYSPLIFARFEVMESKEEVVKLTLGLW